MALQEVDAHSFAQRISLAVRSADDAEGDRHPCTIKNLACRFLRASQPELLKRNRQGACVPRNKCPLADRSTSLGTAGYVDGFASHTLGAGVLEPRRWRPPMSRSPRGVHLAWSEPSVDLPSSGLGVFNQTLRQKFMTYGPRNLGLRCQR